MRGLIIASLLLSLAVPAPAQAFSLRPVGHGIKIAARKTAHVAEESLLVTGMIVAVIAFCSSGACN